MVSYYDKRDALVNLAHALNDLGWKLYGYKQNNSDMASDYYDPAYWHGSAIHPNFPGFVIVGDGTDSGKDVCKTEVIRGKDCEQCNGSGVQPDALNYEQAKLTPEKAHHNISDFEIGVRPLFGGWTVSRHRYHDNGDPKCDRCNGRGYDQTHAAVKVDTHPTYEPTPKGKMWSLQRNGKIIQSGTGYQKCSSWRDENGEAAKLAKMIHQTVEQLHNGKTNQAETTDAPIALTGTCTVTRNEEKDGLEIRFTDKPDQRIIDQLKALKFRWSRFNKCWYAKHSANLEAIAHEIARKLNGNTQPTVEAEQPAEVAEVEPAIALSDAYLAGNDEQWKVCDRALTTLEQKVKWAALMWQDLQSDLKQSRDTEAFVWGEQWANKSEAKAKSSKEKELLSKRKTVELYLTQVLPKFNSAGSPVHYSEATLKRILETGKIEYGKESIAPEPGPEQPAPLPSIFGGDEPEQAELEAEPAIAPEPEPPTVEANPQPSEEFSLTWDCFKAVVWLSAEGYRLATYEAGYQTGNKYGKRVAKQLKTAQQWAKEYIESCKAKQEQPTVEPDPTPDAEPEADETESATTGSGCTFTEAAHLLPGVGAKTKLKHNKAALKLVRSLKTENRQPTQAEKRILSRYVGNGTIAGAIDQEYLDLLQDPTAGLEADNAFQTTPELIQAIWQILENLGFTHGRILDPSCNIGNFIGHQPPQARALSEWAMVEINPDAATIAELLHDDAIALYKSGFEKVSKLDNLFDLVTSNFPFSQIAPFDPKYADFSLNLHNYFWLKSFDSLRVGGIVAALTSTSTLDNPEFCQILADRGATLIGAVRLPNNAFKAMGTQVTTDFIVIQKTTQPRPNAPQWTRTRWSGIENREGKELPINEYFADRPEMVLGKLAPSTLYGGQTSLGVEADGRNLLEALVSAFGKIGKIYQPEPSPRSLKTALVPSHLIGLNPYSFIEQDGKIYQYQPGEGLILITEQSDRIRDGLKLKRVLDNLINLEVANASEQEIESARDRLNGQYGDFTKRYGQLLNPYKRPSTLRVFEDDSELHSMLYALEDAVESTDEVTGKSTVEYRKQDIFYKRISGNLRQDTRQIKTAQDAVHYSLNHTGCLNLELISGLIDKSIDEAIAELNSGEDAQIFYDPQIKKWVLRSEYLSGNTREKLQLVLTIKQADAALFNAQYLHYNEAELTKRDSEGKYININPYLLPPASAEIRANLATKLKTEQDTDAELSSKMFISAGFGTPWLETQHIEEFICHLLKLQYRESVTVDYAPGLAVWAIAASKGASSIAKGCEYSTPERSAIQLIELALNQQKVQVEIYYKDAEGNKVKDKAASEKATNAAIAQQNRIKDEFKQWLWADFERCWYYTNKYNRLFPRPRKRDYSAPWLSLPGSNSAITLNPHQLAGVNRILQHGPTLLLWEVGTGKTFPLIAASYEAKRLGKARKPMLVVLKSTLSQIVGSYRALYPHARLLVAEGEDKNRLYAKIQTGDYDCIILTHDQFYALPVELKTKLNYIQEQLDLIQDYLQGTEKGDRLLKRELEAYQDSLKDEIARIETMHAIETESDPSKLRALLEKLVTDGAIEIGEKGEATYQSQRRKPKSAKEQKLEDKRRDRLTNSVERAMHHYTRNTIKGVQWERLGIDFVAFDECHQLKNLKTASKLYGVAGVSMPDTQRTLNSLLKFRHTSDRGGMIIGATGTMPTNSVAELYVMQRFFCPEELDRVGIKHFDAWIGQFAEATTGLDFTSTGGIKAKTRINRFKNLLQLMDLQRSFTSFATADGVGVKRPNASHITITTPPSDEQLAVMDKIAIYMQMWSSGKDKGAKYYRDGKIIEHNPLTLTNLGSQNAIDPRLIEPEAGNYYDSKLNRLVHNAWWIWKTSAPINGVQLIFCDTGTPTREKVARFTVYQYTKDALIGLGVPAEQIAFIHDYGDKKRKKLFEDINSGKIRFLLGSTEKAGTGVNVQRLCVALHHVDMSWTPAKQEQRNGRGHRQGNLNPNVFVFYYGTSGKGNAPGFDAYKSKLVSDKSAFIYQIMSDSVTDCVAEDIGDDAAMYLMAAAILSGNGQALEHAKLCDRIRAIEADLDQQKNLLSSAHYRTSRLKDRIPETQEFIELAKLDQQAAQQIDMSAKKFKIELLGRTYTKKAEAEEVIKGEVAKALEALKNHQGGITELGKIGDFRIILNTYGGRLSCHLRGKTRDRYTKHYGVYAQSPIESIAYRLGRIAAPDWDLVLDLEKELAADQQELEQLPGRIDRLTPEVERLTAQLAPLRTEEAALRAKLQEEVKDENKEPKKLPGANELVTAPSPALYFGVEPECIEYLKSLPEPTAADAHGKLITWIDQIREQSAQLAAHLANPANNIVPFEAPKPEPQPATATIATDEKPTAQPKQAKTRKAPKANRDRARITKLAKAAKRQPAKPQPKPEPTPVEQLADAVKRGDRSFKLPNQTTKPAKTAKPKAAKPSKVVHGPWQPQPAPAPATKPEIKPLTAEQVQAKLKRVERAIARQFEAHLDKDSIRKVAIATQAQLKLELGLSAEFDGFKYEDQTVSARKNKRKLQAGVMQGCLL